MPRFAFKGFPVASTVSLSVTQNGVTDNAHLANWGEATGSVSIEVDAPAAPVAPTQVWLRAIEHGDLAPAVLGGGSYDHAHHEYYHVWTLRGQPLPAFQAPENMLAEWNNPNRAYGREVAFCLSEPGDYIFDLWVVDRNGVTATAETTTITVEDPETVFAANKTVCIALDGDFTGKPDGAHEVTQEDMLSLYLGRAPEDTRVLFKRGETYTFQNLRIHGDRQGQYFGAWGTGAKPILQLPRTVNMKRGNTGILSFWEKHRNPNVVVTGLEFAAHHDVTTERGTDGGVALLYCANSKATDTFFTFHDLRMRNGGINIYMGSTNTPGEDNRYLVSDCHISDWKDYGIFGRQLLDTKVAIIGNRITQNPDALHGGSKSDSFFNQHGPIRFNELRRAYIACNDLFSTHGWSDAPPGRANQPCLRLFQEPIEDQVATVERNVMEGGNNIIEIKHANAGRSPMWPGNVLIQNNLLIGTAKTGAGVSSWKGGTTVRNNFFVMPDVMDRGQGGQNRSVFGFSLSGSETAENAETPIAVYSNTALINLQAENMAGKTWRLLNNSDDHFTNLTEENNIFHNPAGADPGASGGAVDVATDFAGIAPRFKGVRYGFDVERIAIPATGKGNAFVVPYGTIRQTLQDGTVLEDNSTNQAYWLSAAAAGNDQHALRLRKQGVNLYAEDGHFTVEFGANGVMVTNTSGLDWTAQEVNLNLDRTTLIPAMKTQFGSPATLPMLRPLEDSSAHQTAADSFISPQDLFLTDRAPPSFMGSIDAEKN